MSSLSDEFNSAVLTADKFLLSKDDVAKVLKEFEVLISRFVLCIITIETSLNLLQDVSSEYIRISKPIEASYVAHSVQVL